MNIFRKKNRNKIDDLRIVEITNGLGEISYSVERFYRSGTFIPLLIWYTQIKNIKNYNTAVEKKEQLDTKIKRDKIVNRKIK